MPINAKYFAEEVFTPASEPGEEWEKLHPETKQYLARNVKSVLLDKLGIDLDSEQPGVDTNGNQILYELTEEGEIRNPLLDSPADSEKFLEKMRMGKSFAFPAGYEKPVQLHLKAKLDPQKGMEDMFQFSKPLEESVFPKPKSPNLWARIRHFFGGAKEEYAQYDADMAKYRNGAAMDAQDKRKSILSDEAEEAEKEDQQRQAEAAKAKEKEAAEALKASKEQYHSEMDAKVDLLEEVYGAQPKLREEFVGCQYTTEQFNALKPYDLKEMDVKGPVSNHEFAGVSILAALSPEIGANVRSHSDRTPEENLCTNNTFYTSDLYGWGNAGRANVGDYFKNAQVPARDKAAEAFAEYKKGNKKPLGELIGKGLHFSGTYMQHKTLKESSNIAVNGALGQAVNLLERDKDLMEAAKEAGMTESDLNIARADRKMLEICRGNEWAKGRLEEAAQGKRELTKEEKQACIDARRQYETLNTGLRLEVDKAESSPEYAEAVANGMGPTMEAQAERKKLNSEYFGDDKKLSQEEYEKRSAEIRKKEESGTVYLATQMQLAMGIPSKYRAIGQAEAGNKSAEALNKLVETNLPGHAALDSLSIAELNEALKPENLFAKDSPYMVAPEKPAQAMEPEKQKEAEKEKEKEEEKEGPEEQKDPAQFMDKQTFQERVSTFSPQL